MGFRSKLIISYGAVILVTLGLSIGLLSLIFSQIQKDVSDKTLARLSTVTNEVSDAIATPFPPKQQLQDYQRDLQTYSKLLNVRILLIDQQGKVQADTETRPDL